MSRPYSRHTFDTTLLIRCHVSNISLSRRDHRRERHTKEQPASEDEQHEQDHPGKFTVQPQVCHHGKQHHRNGAETHRGHQNRLASPRLGTPTPELTSEDHHAGRNTDSDPNLPFRQTYVARQRRDDWIERRLPQVCQEYSR